MFPEEGRCSRRRVDVPNPAANKKSILLAGLFLSALVVTLFSTCGLNELVYLYPIRSDRVDVNGNGVEFYHNQANNFDEFLGYEVFYKFYTGDISSVNAALLTDRNFFYERYISSVGSITTQGFHPLYRTGLPDPINNSGNANNPLQPPATPFLSVTTPDNPYAYVIRFPAVYSSQPSSQADIESANFNPIFSIYDNGTVGAVDSDDARFLLYRMPNSNEADSRKSFFPLTSPYTGTPRTTGYSSNDSDLSGFSRTGTLYVGLCVVAYGRDSNFSPIYSEAVVLNYHANYPIIIDF